MLSLRTFLRASLSRLHHELAVSCKNRTEQRPPKPARCPEAPLWRLGIWLSAAAILMCLFGKSAEFDIEFWETWILEFQNAGYQGSSANYPPLLLHWLRLVAWAFNALEIAPRSSLLVKVLAIFPALLCQLAFVDLVGRRLAQRGELPQRSGLFWLTVFNPAFLVNGPIWGQVDLLPILPAYFAITCATDRTLATWALPWLAVALLIKMQAIILIPVIAGLALRHWRQHVCGALLGIAVIALGFLPFALAGADVFDAMRRAYWGNVNLYPFSTVNAANLWCLVVGQSLQPDDLSILSSDWFPEWLIHLATPRKLGLSGFLVLSLAVVISAYRNGSRESGLGLTVVSAAGFFAICSGMHERYLFFAAAFAALWACEAPNRRYWYPLLTALVFINMGFVLKFFGHRFIRLVSAVAVLAFLGLGFQVLFQTNWLDRVFADLCARAEKHPLAPYLTFAALWLILAGSLVFAQLRKSGSILLP